MENIIGLFLGGEHGEVSKWGGGEEVREREREREGERERGREGERERGREGEKERGVRRERGVCISMARAD